MIFVIIINRSIRKKIQIQLYSLLLITLSNNSTPLVIIGNLLLDGSGYNRNWYSCEVCFCDVCEIETNLIKLKETKCLVNSILKPTPPWHGLWCSQFPVKIAKTRPWALLIDLNLDKACSVSRDETCLRYAKNYTYRSNYKL